MTSHSEQAASGSGATSERRQDKRVGVLIVGGSSLERAPDGSYVTRVPIADYVHELSDHMGHCVWLVEDSGTWGVPLREGTARIKGRIDPEKVTVIGINGHVIGAPRNWALFLRYAFKRPYGVFFLPAFLTMVPIFPLAKLFLKRSAVYLAGDYEVTLADVPEGKWFGWVTLYKAFYEGAMKIADCVIARGRHLAKIARRHNPHVIETVPLAHLRGAPSEARELTQDEPRRILYVGILLRSKGLDDLLTALQEVKSRRPEATIELDVLGEGPDRENLESLAQTLGVADCVHFYGWVEEKDEVNQHFSRAHVAVMPTSTHPEGVPRVIDEALVRRIPVVATRIAGVADEFTEGEVLLVDTCAPEQLADGIEAILFDPDIRRSYVDGAERRRLHWSRFTSAADQHAKLLMGEISTD
jgi:glycosyltransferase involved in cell wall biosynthesis